MNFPQFITAIQRADRSIERSFPTIEECGDVVHAHFYSWCAEYGVHKDDSPEYWEQYISELLVDAHYDRIPAGLMLAVTA